MDLIARYGKYFLLKNIIGIYFFYHGSCRVSYDYCKNDAEAIKEFAHKFNVPIERIIIV